MALLNTLKTRVVMCGEFSDVRICAQELVQANPLFEIHLCEIFEPTQVPPSLDLLVVVLNIHSQVSYHNCRKTLGNLTEAHLGRIILVLLSGDEQRRLAFPFSKVDTLCDTFYDLPRLNVPNVQFSKDVRLDSETCARLVSLAQQLCGGTNLFVMC
eukprot:c4030_g1_i1.p1 GENE.c4030_g1_i1~~c4030_g1_i1.p1  ORF type:complete len:156 (+),score=27.13 c4030_g1_i1:40-507(+)